MSIGTSTLINMMFKPQTVRYNHFAHTTNNARPSILVEEFITEFNEQLHCSNTSYQDTSQVYSDSDLDRYRVKTPIRMKTITTKLRILMKP